MAVVQRSGANTTRSASHESYTTSERSLSTREYILSGTEVSASSRMYVMVSAPVARSTATASGSPGAARSRSGGGGRPVGGGWLGDALDGSPPGPGGDGMRDACDDDSDSPGEVGAVRGGGVADGDSGDARSSTGTAPAATLGWLPKREARVCRSRTNIGLHASSTNFFLASNSGWPFSCPWYW